MNDQIVVSNNGEELEILLEAISRPPLPKGKQYIGTAYNTRLRKSPQSRFLRSISIEEHQKNAGLGLPGRNEPCMCGSLKKYKRCCGKF